ALFVAGEDRAPAVWDRRMVRASFPLSRGNRCHPNLLADLSHLVSTVRCRLGSGRPCRFILSGSARLRGQALCLRSSLVGPLRLSCAGALAEPATIALVDRSFFHDADRSVLFVSLGLCG